MWRLAEPLLLEYLASFPCVALVGPRQCGKTTLLGRLPNAWRVFDLERTADAQLVERDADLFLRLNPRQVAIDECQLLPALFPALRVAIDEHRDECGRFVLTGSSSPDLQRSLSESLAGRIGIIEMAPLAWSEVCASPGPRLATLLCDPGTTARDLVAGLAPRGELAKAHEYWFWGGYPEPWTRGGERFRKLWLEQYVGSWLRRDVARLFPGLDHGRYLLFVQMLAGLSGRILNYSEVARALGVSQPTVRDYFEIAHGTYVWRRLRAFERDATKRVVKHPKGYLRDSGLLHHLIRVPDLDALLVHPQVGHSWEGMVIEEVCRQLEAVGSSFEAFHYRTSGGAEVDLVLDADFGLVPVEVKHGTTVTARELKALSAFVEERSCRFGLVITNDVAPRLYSERVVGIPFTHV